MSIKYPFFYVCIGGLILFIGKLYHPVYYLLGIVYLWFLYTRFGWKLSVCYILLSLLWVGSAQYPKTYTEPVITGKIVDTSEGYIVVSSNGAKVKIYGDYDTFSIDDEVTMNIEYFEISKVKNKNAFHYQRYLYGLGIMQQAYSTEVLHHTSNETMFTWLQENIQKQESIASYLTLFLLGMKTEDIEPIYTSLTTLSIVHIFALSGMHIHMLKKWLQNIFRFFVSEKYIEPLILLCIGIYVYSIPENYSFIRSYLVMSIYFLGKKWITKLDALAIACMYMVFKNPYIIYNISFIFSYTMYLCLLFLGSYKYTSNILYIASIPILLVLQYQLQITAVFLMLVFTPIIRTLYMLSLWYLLLGGLIVPLIQVVIYVLESMLLLADILAFPILFSKPTIFFIGIYYVLVGNIMLKINKKRSYKKEIAKLCCVMFVFFLVSRYPITGKIVMIDVGQGDCFLIKQPFNKGNILIDVAGSKKRDIAKDTIVPYLKSEGIQCIDYVFISHDDIDHSGSLESLVELMEVKHIITTYQDPLQIGDAKITMYPLSLQTKESNANSLIFKVELNGVSYLFTGDIGAEEEALFYQQYGEVSVDVLKIPHHGSKYSTSDALLQATTPKVALISCGERNYYQHPHKEVMERLEHYGVEVYRTDTMGMVIIWYVGKENYLQIMK